MPATRRSTAGSPGLPRLTVSPTLTPTRSANASGTSTAPPSRRAAKASSRDAPVMMSPSWSANTFGSIPASAASSWPSAVRRTTGSSSTGLAALRPGVARDGAEGDDRSERDHHRADGQAGPGAVTRQVRASQQALGAEEPLERAADDPAQRLEDVRGR